MKIEELTWRFNFNQNLSLLEKQSILRKFVTDFVEKNMWQCGGSEEMAMYGPKGIAGEHEMKKSLLVYLKEQTNLIKSITILKYDEILDQNLEVEEISF